MARREFNKAEVNFAEIEADLGRLVPPKLSLVEVLEGLRKSLVEQHSKGVTVTQMREVLAGRGIEVSKRGLRIYLEKGELPAGRKAAAAALTRPSEGGESEEPF